MTWLANRSIRETLDAFKQLRRSFTAASIPMASS